MLMSRITNDLFLLSELYHHGPEDLVIYSVKFIGAFVILTTINLQLTLVDDGTVAVRVGGGPR